MNSVESVLPKRIQRKRTKGWKMPPNTVYVGRPGMFGNMFKLKDGWTRAEAVERYRGVLADHPSWREQIQWSLRGKDLACWCRVDQPCHADVLLEIANQQAGKSVQNG